MNYLLPEEIRTLLTNWALRPDSSADLKEIFGTEDSRAHSLIEQIKDGDFSWIPTVEILPSGILNAAFGAYARSTATIYLSDACAEERVCEVLLEEIGHHIDALFNSNETPGDEGTLFSAAVLGLSLSEAEIEAILNEDDSATITLAGKAILVECASDTLGINTSSKLSPASPYTLPSAFKVATLTGSNAYKLTGNANSTNQLLAASLNADVTLVAGGAANTTLTGGQFNNWLDASSNPGNALLVSGPSTLQMPIIGSVQKGAKTLFIGKQAFVKDQILTGTGLTPNTTIAAVDKSALKFKVYKSKSANVLTLEDVSGFVVGETITGSAFAAGTKVVSINKKTSTITLSKSILSTLEKGSMVIGDGRVTLSVGTASRLANGAKITADNNFGNTLIGGLGNSTLNGSSSSANQSLLGGVGNSTILGGTGNLTIVGGTGYNSIVSGNAAPGSLHYVSGGSSTLNSTIIGGSGKDILAGGLGYNTLISGSTTVAHSLFGNGISNYLVAGNAGNDRSNNTLLGDTLTANQGLSGSTTLDGRYSSPTGVSNYTTLLSGTAQVVMYGSADKQSSNYLISGSSANGSQTLIGHGGFNTLVAGQGNDWISVWNNNSAKNSKNVYLFNSNNIANQHIQLTTLSGAHNLLGLNYTPPTMALASTAQKNTNVLFVTSVAGFVKGEQITGNGIAPGTTIVSLDGNSVTLSSNTTDAIPAGSSLSGSALHTTVSSTTNSGTYDAGTILLNVASTTGFAIGDSISGYGINPGTTILSIDTLNSTIMLSQGLTDSITSGTQIGVNAISVLDSDFSRIAALGGTLNAITNYGPGSAMIQLGASAHKLSVSTIIGGNNGDIFTELSSFTDLESISGNTVSISGGNGNDLLAVDSFQQLLVGVFNGSKGIDTIQINTSSTINDDNDWKGTFPGSKTQQSQVSASNFIQEVEVLQLSDSVGSYNQVTLGQHATEKGLLSVYGGQGHETISQIINSGNYYINTGENNDLIQVVNSTYFAGDTIDGGLGNFDSLQIGGALDTKFTTTGTLNTTFSDLSFVHLSNIEILTLNGGSTSNIDTDSLSPSYGTAIQKFGNSNVTFGELAYNTGIQSVYGSNGGNTFTQNSLNGSATTLGPAVSAGATSIRVTTNNNLRVGDVIESSGVFARSAIASISQDTSALRANASSGATLIAAKLLETLPGGIVADTLFAIGETLSGTGIDSGTAITAIDRSALLESAASGSKTLHSADARGFVVGEMLSLASGSGIVASGGGIAAGTTISSITLDRTTLTSSIAGGSHVLNVASTTAFSIGESLTSPSETLRGSGITPGTTIVGIDRSTFLETLATNSSNIHVGSTAGFIVGDTISGSGIASGSILLSTSVDSTTLLESASSGSTTLHAATSGGFVKGETLSGTGIASGTTISSVTQDSTTLRTKANSNSTLLSVASAASFATGETISGTGITSGTTIVGIDRSNLLDSVASGSRTLHVGDTSGFVVGESLIGSGSLANVTLASIRQDTFELLDSAPAGSFFLHYNPASADKLSIGETIFSSAFATGTTIKNIDAVNSVLYLTKSTFDTLAAGTIVTGGGILSLSGGTASSIASGSQITGQGYISLSTSTSDTIASGTSITGAGVVLSLSAGTSGSLDSGSSITGGGVLTLDKTTTATLSSGSTVTGTGHLSLSSGVSGNISALSTITGAGGVLSLSAATTSLIGSNSQIAGEGYLSLSKATTQSIDTLSKITGEYLLSLDSGLGSSIASGASIIGASPISMWGGLGNDVFSVAYSNLNASLNGYSVEEIQTPSLMATDTLNTVIVTGQASINGDNFLNSLTGIQKLQLNSSLGNSVTLSGNGTNTIAGGTGIGTVVAGAGSDTINASGYLNSVTLDATKAKITNKLDPADSLLGSYTKATSFYFSDDKVLGLSTVQGGIANDTIVLTTPATLLDQAFTNKSAIDAVSLQGAGNNSVLIGNMALTAGVHSFYGGNGNDTFTQTTANTNAVYINGGGGNNTYLIYNTTLLSGLSDSLSPLAADTLQRDTIIGGDLSDLLIINDTFTSNLDPNLPAPPDSLYPVTTLNGYDLRYIQSIDQLSLAGSAFVSLSSADSNTGIKSILGGVGDDTFITGITRSYLRSGTGNSYLQAGYEQDYAWKNGKSAYITLVGGGNGGTAALNYTNTLVAYGNEDSIAAGNNGDNVEVWGQSDFVLSGTGDTTTIYNTDAKINLNAANTGSNSRIIFDDGIYSDGTQISTQSLNYTSSTIYGGNSSDTLQFNQDITLNNSFYNIAAGSVGALWLMGDGDSNVTLGESADFRGISTVVAGFGNATVDGTAYTNRQLTYDLTYLDATNSQDYLVGSNVLYNPLNGTRFLIDAVSELANNILVGNDMSFYNGKGTSATLCGIDSITYVATTINGSGVTLNDAVFNSVRQRNLDVLVLNSNYNRNTGSLSGNQVQIGTNFASTNLSTIVGSSSGDQYVLTSTFGQNSTYVGGSGALGGYIGGGSGGDKFSLAGNYLDSNGPAADKITLNGGGSVDGLYFTTSGINLYDSSSRSDLANVKNMEGLFFDTVNSGTNSVILDKYATLSGLASIRGGSGIFSALAGDAALSTTTLNVTNGSLFAVGQQVGGTGFAYGTTIIQIAGNVLTLSQATTASLKSGSSITTNGDTLTQTGNFSNAFSMIGGNGNDLFKLNGSSLLGGAGGNDTYIAGNSGYDTLWVANNPTLTDAMFAGLTGIEALSLSGAASVVLDSNAKSAGFSWVYGSSLKATIDNVPASLGDTISHAVNGRAVTMVGAANTLGTARGDDFFSLGNATLLANQNATLSGDSISGGLGNDTLQITSGADPFYDSLFGRVSSVEAMKLTDTLIYPQYISTLFLDSNASTTGITMVAGSDRGNVITQGSANAKSLSLVGGSSADMFNVATRAQFGSDTFVGDLGTDTIYVTSGGGTYADADFSKINGIEIISLGGSSAVTASLGATAMGAGFTGVYGGSGFNSLFQTSAFTTALTLKGGDAGNSFAIASSTLIGNDTIIGGSGIDSLSLLTDSQTLTDALFVKSLYSIDVLKTANGTNSIVAGPNAQSSLLTIVGGTGADTIVTSDYSAMTITGGGGADSLITGSKNDYFTFATATDLGAVATVNGGSGNNTVGLTTDAQTVLDTAFTKYTNVELFKTANGANNITFSTQAQDAGIASIFGGIGADTINASAFNNNLNITGNGGADYLYAGTGNDLFNFTSLGHMTAAETVSGGKGTNTLSLSGDAAVSATILDAAFAKLSSIQVFKTADGSNVLSIGSLATQAGINTVIGGNGTDSFNVSGAFLNDSFTSIVGGQSTDTVAVSTDAQTIGDTAFTRLSSIEVFQTGNGKNLLTISTGATTAGISTVIGGSGPDMIDASTRTSSITINGNGGADSLLAGSGNDRFLFSTTTNLTLAAAVSGNIGTDTVALTSDAQAINDAFGKISSIEVFQTGNGANSVTLFSSAAAAGISTVVGGIDNDTINATSLTSGITINGNGGADFLLAGSGNDQFLFTTASTLSAAATVSGNTGIDTVALTIDSQTVADAAFTKLSLIDVFQTANGTNSVTLASFASAAGINSVFGGVGSDKFVASSTFFSDSSTRSLLGGDGYSIDTLTLSGTAQTIGDAAFTKLSSIEVLQTGNGANSITLAAMAGAEGISTIVGGTDNDTINATSLTSGITINGNGGTDSLLAGSGNDQFLFTTATNLTLAAAVRGGLGTDTVALTSDAQTVGDTAFTKLSSIEGFQTANGTNAVTLASLASAAGITLLSGGSGNDSFNVSSTFFSNSSTASLLGGLGIDTLTLSTDAQTIGSAAFAKLSSIDVFQTGNGANSITMDTLVSAAGISTVIGGTAADTIIASLLSAAITINGNGGADYLYAGTGNDQFLFSTATNLTLAAAVRGGLGTDTVALTSDAQTVGDTAFTKLSSIEGFQTANGTNAVTLASLASAAGITLLSGGSGNDSFNVSSTFFSNSSTASLLGGLGIDTLTLSTDAQTIGDAAFTKLSSIEFLQAGNGANSITLATNAAAAGISTFSGGLGNDNFIVSSAIFSNTSTASLLGGSLGIDTLTLSTDAQTIGDTAFSKLNHIQVLQTANGVNSIVMASKAILAGIKSAIGGKENDNLNANAYSTSVILDGGGASTTADTLTGGNGMNSDRFILGNAGATSTYYGTNSTGTDNYVIVTSLASDSLVNGANNSDKLQLNQSDFNNGKYSLGNSAGDIARTTTHFGLYDNGMFVGDITTSGFSVSADIAGQTEFLKAANNHVTYV